jgi:hypothetical protein
MLGFVGRGLTNPERGNVNARASNRNMETVGHMVESTENLETLHPPRARCSCRSIYS